MRTGFEVTAAVPKRLRAAEDPPAHQPMRGERKITQAPSTDQKKVRRAMQRKTAAPSHVIYHDEESGENLHGGRWGDLQVGDRMVGLDGAKVTHVGPSDKVVSGVRMVHVRTQHPTNGEQDHHEFPFSPVSTRPEDQSTADLAFYRKHSVMNDVGDCRLCGGNLVPEGHQGETMKARCADCGAGHQLQTNTVDGHGRTAAQRFQAFQNLSAEARARIEVLAHFEQAAKDPCPNCGDATWGMRNAYGLADSSDLGLRTMVHCKACDHYYTHRDPADHPAADSTQHGRTAASHTARLLRLVEASWEIEGDTSPYLGQTGMSAIARRAQSVLDTKENP